MLLVGYLVFSITYPLFCILYAFYGSVLYVCAPLVLALYPALSTTGLARSYLTNLIIFHSWGLIYAILGCLMSAIHLGTVADVLARGDAGGFFAGVGEALLLGLSSILLALCIALIPMIARRVVQGDVGSTMFAVMGAAATAATLGVSMAINGSVGLARALGGDNDGPSTGGGGGVGGGKGQGAKSKPNVADQSSQSPPKPPGDKVLEGTGGSDGSGTEGRAPEGAKSTEPSIPDAESATTVGNTAGQNSGGTNATGDGNRAARGNRSSSRGAHWNAGARVYTPMSLSALASMGAGSLLGTGLRKATNVLRSNDTAGDQE